MVGVQRRQVVEVTLPPAPGVTEYRIVARACAVCGATATAPDVTMIALRWYLRYGLSYRDVEELLAERNIVVDHVSIHRWVQRFTLLLIDAARPCRHVPGDRWFVDESYVKIAGQWVYLYRAIDQFGQVIDVLSLRKGIWSPPAGSSPMLSGTVHIRPR